MLSAVEQGVQQRGISLLSRAVSSASFRSSPIRTRAVPLIHDVVAELLRLDLCMTTSGDRYLLLRTRHWHRRRVAQAQYRRQAHAQALAAQAPRESSHLEDCIEDVLLLQTALLRALPDLACRYVCLAGSATAPYEPSYNYDVVHAASLALGASSSRLPPFDDGVGVAVRPLLTQLPGGQQQFELDPLSFTKIACTLLERDARLDASNGGPDLAAGTRGAAAAAETLDDDPAAVRRLQRHTGIRHGAHSHSSSGADDVQVLMARVLDFLAAVSAGPLAADGRSCADHVLSFLHPPYARARLVRRTPPGATPAIPDAGVFGAGDVDAPYDADASPPPADVDDSAFPCPDRLRLASLLGSLALTTTAVDPDHARLREAAYSGAQQAHQAQSASVQAREMSLREVPLVDVYSLRGCVVKGRGSR